MGLFGKKNVNAGPKELTTKGLLSYCFALFGFQMIVGLLQTYQAQFFNKFMGLDFLFIGIILGVCKIASAFIDPLIGQMIDKTNTKIGKLKPYIWASIPPLIILTVVIFTPWPGLNEASLAAKYAYVVITFFLWCVAMSLGDIPSQAMGSVLTTVESERTNAISLGNTFKTVGLVFPAAIMPLCSLMVPEGANGFGGNFSEMEYLVGGIVTVLLGCVLFALTAINNQEKVPYHAEKITIKQMFKGMKENKYLLIAFLTYIIGFGRMGAVAIATQTAGALLGQETQSMFVGLSTAIGGMVSMLITPMIVKKFNIKRGFIGMSIFHFVVSGLTMLVAWKIGFSGHDGWQIWVIYLLLFFRGLGCGAYYVMPALMIADAVDFSEWKLGRRSDGIAWSVNSLAIKITMALCTIVGYALISVSGYTTDFTVTQEGAFTTQMWVFFAFCGFPGIFYLLSAIPMFFWDLTGKKKETMQAELKLKWAAEKGELPEETAETAEEISEDAAADDTAAVFEEVAEAPAEDAAEEPAADAATEEKTEE
ncbi:MAG: MFS transporter [Clostridia bacterium]|nr:MFS transporter [Clostridia bacterium]